MNIIKEDEILTPKYDFIFKKIFGEDEQIFTSFAESVLYNGEHKIKSVRFLNSNTQKNRLDDKECRFDVLATLDDNSRINLEIQLQNSHEYERRCLYYWSKLYEEQLNAGQTYFDLRPAISINILDFDFFKGKQDFHTVLGVMNLKDKTRYCHDFEIHYIEIPKAKEEVSDLLGKWILFLNTTSLEKLEELAMSEPIIAKATHTLRSLSHDPEVRAIYEARKKYMLDFNTEVKGAKTEGKTETAKNLKNLGVAIETIVQATGLNKEEIEKL